MSQDSPKLPDRMRAEIRVRHYSIRTGEDYVDGERRLILSQQAPRGRMSAAKIHGLKVNY